MKHPIANASNMIIGNRLVFLDCTVHFISSYVIPEAERNRAIKSTTVFRQVFRTPLGPIIYSGKNLGLRLGQNVTLCGTIKRFEHFGKREQVRLSIVKVIEKPAQILMDF
jgi:hypothetical protein